MKPLKKFTAVAVLLIGILAFSKNKSTKTDLSLNLDEINVEEILSKQEKEGRTPANFSFYVETDLVKKIRGASNINAKVYILDKSTGKKSLLAEENIQIKKYQDAIALGGFDINQNLKSTILENGDKIIGSSEKTPFAFDKLVKYETIYNDYIDASNKLLRLKRSI